MEGIKIGNRVLVLDFTGCPEYEGKVIAIAGDYFQIKKDTIIFSDYCWVKKFKVKLIIN